MKSLSIRKPTVHLARTRGVKTVAAKVKGAKVSSPKAPKAMSMTDALKKVKW